MRDSNPRPFWGKSVFLTNTAQKAEANFVQNDNARIWAKRSVQPSKTGFSQEIRFSLLSPDFRRVLWRVPKYSERFSKRENPVFQTVFCHNGEIRGKFFKNPNFQVEFELQKMFAIVQ